MREFFEERARLLIAAGIVLVLIVAGFHLLGGDSENNPAGTLRRTAQELQGQEARAQDAAAESLLRSAAIAMESYYAEHQGFGGTPADLAAVEPNITWVDGAGGSAAGNEVGVVTTPVSYTLQTASGSGKVYAYERDQAGNVKRVCGPGCTW